MRLSCSLPNTDHRCPVIRGVHLQGMRRSPPGESSNNALKLTDFALSLVVWRRCLAQGWIASQFSLKKAG